MKRSFTDTTWDTELLSKATVEHHQIENTPYMLELKKVLEDVAKDLQRVKIANPNMEYMGSFSVHVFESPLKGTFEFVPVTNSHKCYYKLAEAAIKKLGGDIQDMYRGQSQKHRSGFPSGV